MQNISLKSNLKHLKFTSNLQAYLYFLAKKLHKIYARACFYLTFCVLQNEYSFRTSFN